MPLKALIAAAIIGLAIAIDYPYDSEYTDVTYEVTKYKDPTDDSTLIGYVAYPDGRSKVPAVLVVHDWNGLDAYEKWRARRIAKEFGYVGFAMDIYGNGSIGSSPAENRHLMTPFREDRLKLLRRLEAGLEHARTRIKRVNTEKVASMGYCFGGMASIDMARAGMNISGVASFHGALQKPTGTPADKPILAKVLVMTGYDDSSIPPKLVNDFQKEMKGRGADFEVNSYSDTVHSFTVPDAAVPGRAEYNVQSDTRSWSRFKNFLEEIFQ